MPAKSPRARLGLDSRVITPHMRAVVAAVRQHRSATEAAKRLGLSRETVVTTIRIVEGKLGRRLFSRVRGPGNQEWMPVETTAWGRFDGA